MKMMKKKMMMTINTTTSLLLAAAALALPAPLAFAQTRAPTTTVTTPDDTSISGDDAPEWMKKLGIDPTSPKAKLHAQQTKTRKAAEKELRKLRMKYFARSKHIPTRQEGLAKLREYTDPALFPAMIEIFKNEDPDVRLALLDQFRDAQSDEGDTALAWVAVQDDNEGIRSAAGERLHQRINKDKAPPEQVKLVIFEGLRTHKNSSMVAAAQLAQGINLVDVIPWLISAQVTGVPAQQAVGVNTGSGNGALAWIMVGQQTAYVSDLIPVVGTNAVAFDPQLSVINTGVILRVLDAVVVEYHVDIHNILTDWSTREFGESTKDLGYDIPAWNKWYKEDFTPRLAQKTEEKKAQEQKAKTAAAEAETQANIATKPADSTPPR